LRLGRALFFVRVLSHPEHMTNPPLSVQRKLVPTAWGATNTHSAANLDTDRPPVSRCVEPLGLERGQE